MFRYTDVSCIVNLFSWCRHSGRSHLSAVVSNAAVSAGAFSNIGYGIRSEVAGSRGNCVFRSLRGRIAGCCHGGPGTWANRVTGTWLRPGGEYEGFGTQGVFALEMSVWKRQC